MLPAPDRIAAAPRPKSKVCWNPAVPPPPVAGAAVGTGLADRLGVADFDAAGLGVADFDAAGLAVADRLPEGWAVGLALVVGAVPPVARVGRPVGVAEPVPPGENVAGVAEGEDPVQAETVAEANMVTVAQPATVNLALSPFPRMVVRILIGPPQASGRWRARFADWSSERETRAQPPRRPGGPKADPGNRHKGKAHGRHRHAMAYSSLKY
jgi:hypothetical protein